MDIIEPAYQSLIANFSTENVAGFEDVAAGHEIFLQSILSGSVMDKELGISLQGLYGPMFDCVESLVNDPSSDLQIIQQVPAVIVDEYRHGDKLPIHFSSFLPFRQKLVFP
jgi:hypothetical protein